MDEVSHGREKNGVVVLDSGVRLPAGHEVTVLAQPTVPSSPWMEGLQSYSVLDIGTVTMGSVLRPLAYDDDMLGEMLEGRP